MKSQLSVSIQVTVGDPSPQLGHNYTLTCEVTANVTNYEWFKDGEKLENDSREILFFSALSLVNAGLYTCQVLLESMIYRVNKSIELQSKSLYFVVENIS